MLSKEEKLRILETLDRDVEFRYAIAGYLGLSEILKRLDSIESRIADLYDGQKKLLENQVKLWENVEKLWEEVRSLREGQSKLWEEVRLLREGQDKLWMEIRDLREGQSKLWEEVRSLREGQSKLWENAEKLWIEVRSLREGQGKLWENVNNLWIEVRLLREGQDRLWEEVRDLRSGQNKLWESVNNLWIEVKSLREGQNKLWEEVRDLRVEFAEMRREQKRLRSSFESFGRALGVTIEYYACAFVELMLEDMGYTGVSVDKGFVYHDGRVYEIDIFCEDPLVVGEATLYIRDRGEAESELKKLDVKAEAAEKSTGRKIILKVLAVANVSSDAMGYLKDECMRRGVRLVVGRELEVIV
jgi:uncharacterized coiled-coil DUF342 family protein